MGNAKLNLIESMRRLLYFHTTNTTSESSLVHDIRNLIGGELTETMGPVDSDPAHHAPSPTKEDIAVLVADTDKYFKPPQAKHDEPLTKRERFAMECLKSIMAGRSIATIDILAKDEGGAQVGACKAAVKLADHLIAELAKERT